MPAVLRAERQADFLLTKESCLSNGEFSQPSVAFPVVERPDSDGSNTVSEDFDSVEDWQHFVMPLVCDFVFAKIQIVECRFILCDEAVPLW